VWEQTRYSPAHWVSKFNFVLRTNSLYLLFSATSKSRLPKGYGFILTDFDTTPLQEGQLTCWKHCTRWLQLESEWLRWFLVTGGAARVGLILIARSSPVDVWITEGGACYYLVKKTRIGHLTYCLLAVDRVRKCVPEQSRLLAQFNQVLIQFPRLPWQETSAYRVWTGCGRLITRKILQRLR